MIILGLTLVLVGWLVSPPILVTIGIILLAVGLLLALLGAVGRPVAGRRIYW